MSKCQVVTGEFHLDFQVFDLKSDLRALFDFLANFCTFAKICAKFVFTLFVWKRVKFFRARMRIN